jgi:hypothetical protein
MVYRDGKIIECRVEGIRDTDMLLKRKINRWILVILQTYHWEWY